MLSYLTVKDFALIENVDVEFHPGFNALTGETGAGKTVLVGAIALLLGGRAEILQVRAGADEAAFSCSFDISGNGEIRERLTELGFLGSDEKELTLGRVVSTSGKSRCTLNGTLCPVSTLAHVGETLVDIHGQNAHQALLKAGSHINYLDRFAGAAQLATLQKYVERHGRLKNLLREREAGEAGGSDIERETELLRFELAEIAGVDPNPGEIEEVETEAERFRHARELWETCTRVSTSLGSDGEGNTTVRDILSQVVNDLRRMSQHDATVGAFVERVESASFELEDVADEIDGYRDRLEKDPARMEEIEARLSALRTLARKYGGTLEAASAYAEEAARKLETMEATARRLGEIDGEIEELVAEVELLAGKLSKGRIKASATLARTVMQEMKELELSGAGFEVKIEGADADTTSDGDSGEDGSRRRAEARLFGPTGTDTVEFMFSPEPNESLKPLRRIASGGEMSRVMLALKIVLASADGIPILIFDEVDAGIGGETASRVGQKLFQLTKYHQVFCVTHLPQIATFADWQYRVFKRRAKRTTNTDVELLEGDARVDEMCRMLGDSSGGGVTIEHARDILARAEKLKSSMV